MKQEMLSFLSTIDSALYDLTRYLYDNPEESFHEYKSYSYITKLLESYNFTNIKNYLDINTAFLSQFGEGHPKICFICEYDADVNYGHIYGYNAKTTISVAAALMLSHVIPKVGGSVILLGCPGEFKRGSKTTMFKQGTFEDMDAVLTVQPHTVTAESGTSIASLPLSLILSKTNNLTNTNDSSSSFNTALIIFNTLNHLINISQYKSCIDNLSLSSLVNSESKSSEITFTLKSSSSENILGKQDKIKEFIMGLCNLVSIESELHIKDTPCKELISNATLSRLFSHNLKESEIININGVKNLSSSLSLGIVSHEIPCIHPYVSLTKDSSIKYGTKAFSDETITPYAHNIIMKSSKALALTALDLIENNSLLFEAKSELNHK
ncbi:amidohydrolase [Clostridium acetobutylicum]|nr:amidohydrolase [Clostridium acetobutylicum]